MNIKEKMDYTKLVDGKQYFYNGEWMTYFGAGSACQYIFTGKTKSYSLSKEEIEKLVTTNACCSQTCDLNSLVIQFRNGAFGKNKNFQITDIDEIIESCVPHGWRDLQRTLGGISKYPSLTEKAFSYLKKEIKNYFCKKNYAISEKDFDNWHKSTCDELINIFSGFVRTRNNKKTGKVVTSSYGFTYGTSQKFLNMTLKYIYCFDFVRNTFRNCFQHCHMALDQYTAEWIREVAPTLPLIKKVKTVRVSSDPSKINDFSFSKINDYADYLDVQNAARVSCNDVKWANCGVFLIEKEFCIWDFYRP